MAGRLTGGTLIVGRGVVVETPGGLADSGDLSPIFRLIAFLKFDITPADFGVTGGA